MQLRNGLGHSYQTQAQPCCRANPQIIPRKNLLAQACEDAAENTIEVLFKAISRNNSGELAKKNPCSFNTFLHRTREGWVRHFARDWQRYETTDDRSHAVEEAIETYQRRLPGTILDSRAKASQLLEIL
jgi:hypothetical protein